MNRRGVTCPAPTATTGSVPHGSTISREVPVKLPSSAHRAVLASLVGGLVLTACSGSPDPVPAPAEAVTPAPTETPEPEPVLTARAPLTGVLVEDEVGVELAERPLLIAKIENSAAARPQAGLDRADVVIEELTEGGVTRFITLFHSHLPDEAGPVRSARPVDVAVASGFGKPVFAHSGARAQVQSMLAAAPMISLEEGAPGFMRVSDRRRPHNLFVRPADVLAAGIDRGATPITAPDWTFAEDAPDGAVTCAADAADCEDPGAGVTVRMSNSARAGWTYDEDAGVYRRDQNGEASTVTGEGRIGAANVVVLATRHYQDGCCDTNGSPYTETDVLGGDVALYWRDGQRFEGTWRKPTADAPLELLDADGAPFALKPGPTWLHLPSAASVAGL